MLLDLDRRHWKQVLVLCTLVLLALSLPFRYAARNLMDREATLTFRQESRCPLQPIIVQSNPLDGASAKTFGGEKTRNFPATQRVFQESFVPAPIDSLKPSSPSCDRWAVLTTILRPSEALRRLLLSRKWCVVVVGDYKTPAPYTIPWTILDDVVVVYMSPEDQRSWEWPLLRFVPFNSFSRKNIGYLFALKHGAKVIWDFDDDNLLKFWVDGAATATAPSLDPFMNLTEQSRISVKFVKKNDSSTAWNPYPYLGVEYLPCWPRGMPLNEIHQSSSYKLVVEAETLSWGQIGVLQSVADVQPDLDAIFRISHKSIVSFARINETKPVMTPDGVFSPYNAQATLHNRPAFWALLLPATVSGRVSDIWRSFFAQRLFRDAGLHLGFFARPLVVHDRSSHSLVGDLKSEEDLYEKTHKLIEFLNDWESEAENLPARMEELWIEAYERDYIQIDDVYMLQEWLKALLAIGYGFPEVKKKSNQVNFPIRGSQDEISNDGKVDECSQKKLNIWFSGWHMGTLMDIPSALLRMGHRLIFEARADRFPNPGVMGHPNASLYNRISTTVSKWWYPNRDEYHRNQDAREHFEFYKNDPVVASVDVFVCMFPAAFCELWLPFNKSILFLPATRYSLGRCYEQRQWDLLDKHLWTMHASKDPHHVVAASSIYEMEYLKHYTGITDVVPLFSYSGFYTEQYEYKPERPEVISLAHHSLTPDIWRNFVETARKSEINVKSTNELYDRFYKMENSVTHPRSSTGPTQSCHTRLRKCMPWESRCSYPV